MAGLTVGGTESKNLLTRSEEFDHGDWSKAGVTVTADDATAPDGSTTADKVEDDATGSAETIRQDVTVPDDTLTRVISVFVKKVDTFSATCVLQLVYGNGGTAEFPKVHLNPATGDVAEEGAPDDSGVEDEGTYWRLWLAHANNGTGNTLARFEFFPAANNNAGSLGSRSATATGSQHLWGAQLEEGSEPGVYVTTESETESTVVNGTTFTVASGSMSREEIEIGERVRSFRGTQRQYMRNRVNEWSGQTVPLTPTDKDTIVSTLRSSTQPQTCAGNLVVSLGDLVDCFTAVESIEAVLASTGQRHVVRFLLMESS